LAPFSPALKIAIVNQAVYQVKYADSVLYLKNQSNDYIVLPVGASAGTFSAFPEGIEIDDNTGAINVTKSETGLRYRITLYFAGRRNLFNTRGYFRFAV